MEETHVWNQKLDLGHEALDREHHLQVALASGLADALERGQPRLARRLLEQLDGYARVHFEGEELLMELARYAQLAAHRQEHQAMLAQLGEIRQLLDRGEYDLAGPMAVDFLTGLGAHISASDRRFAEQSRMAAPPGEAAAG